MAEQLARYRSLPDENAAVDAILELLRSSPDPLARHIFEPGHLTVGAFVVAGNQMLLIHHRRLGIWLEPGGHVDPEDVTLEAAAARELLEETGIPGRLVDDGIFDVDVHPIPAGKGEPAHRHFNIGYLFTADPVEPVAAPEVVAARWVDLDDVPALNTDAAVHRAAAKLRSL